MAEKKLNVRFKQRIDMKENWESANPVLYEGEIAAVKVGGQVYFKIGDGTSNFNDLPITQSIAADVYDWAKAATKPTYGVSEITGLSAELAKKANTENANGGFNAGNGSDASTGAAVGSSANAIEGGAIGESALTGSGFSGGLGASSSSGGAVGGGAETSDGFAGGLNAKTIADGSPIDAIQLGTGTNPTEKTLQVYEYQMMDASGNIPAARLTNAPKTTVEDVLTSTSTTNALSANQGKVLKGLIDTISTDYVSKSTGGTISGDVSFSGAVTSTNPVSVGAPTADGHAATKSYVDTEINSKIAAADALIFKGAVDPASFPGSLASCKTGWTYKASAAGTIFTDIKVEIGDMIIAIADCDNAEAVANKNNWTVIQANLDGTVTGPKSATSDNIAVFDGATGKLIKDSSKKISDLALKTEVDAVDTKVGTLDSLTTTDKTSIVNAVNEVKSGVTAVSGAPTSVEAGSGLTASIADNKLSIAFDDSITFVLEAGGASLS
jgi:hypothetical protein